MKVPASSSSGEVYLTLAVVGTVLLVEMGVLSLLGVG